MSLPPYRIAPYKAADGGWYFDAPKLGIHREALVRGADALLDAEAGSSVILEFADAPFTGADMVLARERPGLQEEDFGTWYRDSRYGRPVWLCDTLSLYFSDPPERIHLRILPPV